MDNLDVQKDKFEKLYRDYKNYTKIIESKKDSIEERKKDFVQFAIENKEDITKVSEEYFKISEEPLYQANDLTIIKRRLKYLHEAYIDILDIPKEISKEISEIDINDKLMYEATNNELKLIDTPYNNEKREYTRSVFSEQVVSLLKGLDG